MSYRSTQSNLPGWFVFILAVTLVFGIYFMWVGLQDYLAAGLPLPTPTATDDNTVFDPEFSLSVSATPVPTRTPVPECLEFVVSVPSAIIRQQPTTASAILDTVPEGEAICVISQYADTEWYLIDFNRRTNRLEEAYMHEDVIEAANPTLTPTDTFTPPPSVTPMPTVPVTETPTPSATNTRNPDDTDTPTPSPTLTPTVPIINA